jgi:hypothetical protein
MYGQAEITFHFLFALHIVDEKGRCFRRQLENQRFFMLLGVLLNILIIATIVGKLSNAQQTYEICYICGAGNAIRGYYDLIVMPDQQPYYCGSIQDEGLLGLLDPYTCLWVQDVVQGDRYYCACQAIQAPVSQPPPPTLPQPTTPPQRQRSVVPTPTDDAAPSYSFVTPLVSVLVSLLGASGIFYIKVTFCSVRQDFRRQ